MSQQNKLMGVGQSAASAAQIVGDVASGLTATGTSQSGALPLSCACNYVETVASGTGVRLYGMTGRPSSIGDEQSVYNAGANTLSVYPPSGEQILGVSQDAAFSLPASTGLTFKKIKNGLWISLGIFVPSGTGALTRTVASALSAIKRSGDYSSVPNFNTATDTLTETIGVRNMRVGVTTAASSAQIYFPSRTSGRGGNILAVVDMTFLSTADPVVRLGYNINADGTEEVAGEPGGFIGLEGNYNDGSGANKMESYIQWQGLPGQASSQYRPFFTQANRSTGDYQNQIGASLTQFVARDMSNSVLDVYSEGANGILSHKKVTIDTITANSGLGLTLKDNSGTPITINFTPSWSVNGGAPALVTGGAYGMSISAGGTENLRMPYISGAVNFIVAHGSATTGISVLATDGSDTDVALGISSKGTDPINLYTNGAFTSSVLTSATLQVQVTHTASANRNITLTGSNGGNPSIGVSAGRLNVSSALTLSSLGAFAASDKYLIADSSGNVHISALGPAS